MRSDVSAQLEHDLCVAAERDRARVSTPTLAADEGDNRRARPKAGDLAAAEALPPEPEEVSERRLRAYAHLDHAGWIQGAKRVGAATGNGAVETNAKRPRYTHPGRNDDNLPAHEQLEVHSESIRPGHFAAQAADRSTGENRRRRGRKSVTGPDTDRPRPNVRRQG
jgi:hypothetical protein